MGDRQLALVAKFTIITDAMERLSVVISRRVAVPKPAVHERTESALVPGCVSRVWLVGEVEEGTCRYRVEADSPMVHGLASLLAELFDGAAAVEAAAFSPTLLADLGFERVLSPTRLRGLGEVSRRLREIARAAVPG